MSDNSTKLIADQVRQQTQAQQPAPQSVAVGQAAMGLPSPLQPMAPPAMQSMAAVPQPTGVNVPVTVPLPDGRELSVRVEFGPEAAQNLQAVGAMAAQLFGPYLQARNPYYGRGGYDRGYGGYNNGRSHYRR